MTEVGCTVALRKHRGDSHGENISHLYFPILSIVSSAGVVQPRHTSPDRLGAIQDRCETGEGPGKLNLQINSPGPWCQMCTEVCKNVKLKALPRVRLGVSRVR